MIHDAQYHCVVHWRLSEIDLRVGQDMEAPPAWNLAATLELDLLYSRGLCSDALGQPYQSVFEHLTQ